MGYNKVSFEKSKEEKDQKRKGGKLEPQKKPKHKKKW
jgi:hypothetical protein